MNLNTELPITIKLFIVPANTKIKYKKYKFTAIENFMHY